MEGVRFKPERAGSDRGINASLAPPCGFVTVAMDFSMMAAAQRHCELIADFATERPALRKAQVVGVARLPAADQTSLVRHKPHVLAVANAARLRQRQRALFDALGPQPAFGLFQSGQRKIGQ